MARVALRQNLEKSRNVKNKGQIDKKMSLVFTFANFHLNSINIERKINIKKLMNIIMGVKNKDRLAFPLSSPISHIFLYISPNFQIKTNILTFLIDIFVQMC